MFGSSESSIRSLSSLVMNFRYFIMPLWVFYEDVFIATIIYRFGFVLRVKSSGLANEKWLLLTERKLAFGRATTNFYTFRRIACFQPAKVFTPVSVKLCKQSFV